MLNFVEIVSFLLMGMLCIQCTKSDLKFGLIYNRILTIFFGCAVFLDAVYYGFFAKDLFRDFAFNFLVVSLLSLYLFFTHSFAGGDCKLAIVLSMLYPARYYLNYRGNATTLVFAIGLALFAGYCYLLVYSIISIATKTVKLTKAYIKNSLLHFLKVYFSAMLYLSLANSVLLMLYHQGFAINIWFSRCLCLLIAWSVGKYPILRRWEALVLAGISTAVISFVLRNIPFSLNPENYTLTLVLLLCQLTIKTTLYEDIPVSSLKKGMILSSFSSVLMQTSITPGLPGVSTENLKSRLTSEEVDSIQIWAKATHTQSLTVVKKIPFAIFISIGFLCYCILGSILE